jgi:uncharacterized membrane protein
MKLFQRILSNLSFFILVMLLFLLLFQNKVSLPPVLQATGRTHPLLLHLPIGFIILSFILWLFRKQVDAAAFEKMFVLVLHIAAFTAVLTALLGFFLSKEEGYDIELLLKHKFLGVTTAIFSYLLLLLYPRAPGKKKIFGGALTLTLAAIIFGSHFGSVLTHGEDFVWTPLQKEEAENEIITGSSTLFSAAVRPILKSKCFSCHNERKAKGGLVMTSEEKILAGGKNGPAWKAGDAQNSRLIQNINRPEEEKKHMPPKGKPQLTPDEMDFLFAWIEAGADMKKRLNEYDDNDTLKILASRFIRQTAEVVEEKQYAFKAASFSLVQKLNDPFCSVFPLSQNSPALQADFFVREKFDRNKLQELLKVKEQLVNLNLGNMPAMDEDMKTVSSFTHLEKLNLNNTAISNKGLEEIKKLKMLQSLSLAGTKVDKNAAPLFAQLDSLKEVFTWNSGISPADAAALQRQYKKIHFNSGYVPGEKEILFLTPPSVKNEEFVLAENERIELKHAVPGVTIRYTTDGSIPDSSSSPVYKEAIEADRNMVVKARAVKPGWYSSPVAEFSFFKKGRKPTNAELINPPDEKYKGEGEKTLIDGKLGAAENFNDAAWLGFREKPFAAWFYFAEEPVIGRICIRYNKSIPSYLLPPAEVEVWGGYDKIKMKLLKKVSPWPATKEELNAVKAETVMIEIPPSSFRYYKVVAKNLLRLPAWHPGKGDRAWVFIDEIFFN